MLVISGTWLWKKVVWTHVNKPNGEWKRVAEKMMINFSESGHPIFQATSPLERGELKSKSGGKKTIHYNGCEETVELIVNQLSIYGAVADLCNELDPDYAESVICESLVIPTERANADATPWIFFHPMKSCTSEQFKGIQEKTSLIHHCKTILLPDDFAEYIYHIGNANEMHSFIKSGLISWGKSNRRNRQSVFFTAVNPIDIQPNQREVEYDLDKPRIDSIKLDRMQLLFQTHYQRFYRQSVLHENKGRTLLQIFQVSQVTSHNTCAELATRSEGCTCFRIEKIRCPWEWSSSEHGIPWQWPMCWFSNPWHSTFRCWTSWNNSKRKSSTINWAIRKSPKQEHAAQGLQEIGGDQPLQSRMKGLDYWNGEQRNLRVLRDFFEETMSRLRRLLGKC